MPVFGMKPASYAGFAEFKTRDIVLLASESTANLCNEAPHWSFIVDVTVENSKTALVLVADAHVACSPCGRALALEPLGPRFSEPAGPARLLRALAACARAGRHGRDSAEIAFAAV